MATVTLQAYAKVNLGLDILGMRDNGYHDVKMVMQTIDLFDTLRFSTLPEDVIRISSNDKEMPCNANNLVYQAIDLLKKEFAVKKGVEVHIDKHIPMAAGMAGGSSDCAAALKACNLLFELHLSEEALMGYGKKLGADVPYCIMGGTALAEGIGEKLTRLPAMPDCYIVVAKPPVSMSTRDAYRAYDHQEYVTHPDIEGMVKAMQNENLDGVTSRMANVLEKVTEKLHPEIVTLKDMMRTAGAKNAMMTGSGPTVFGIFDANVLAEDAKNEIVKSGIAKSVYVVRPMNALS